MEVSAAVTIAPEVQAAERAAIDAEETAGKTDAIATAYEHRRAMIKAEVEMWLNNYWGDVTVKQRTMRPVEQAAADAQETKVLNGMMKRRRRLTDEE